MKKEKEIKEKLIKPPMKFNVGTLKYEVDLIKLKKIKKRED